MEKSNKDQKKGGEGEPAQLEYYRTHSKYRLFETSSNSTFCKPNMKKKKLITTIRFSALLQWLCLIIQEL